MKDMLKDKVAWVTGASSGMGEATALTFGREGAIVIVGAMLAAALTSSAFPKLMGVVAVALAAVNIFGGFLVTHRMLEMFKKKERPAKKEAADAKEGA